MVTDALERLAEPGDDLLRRVGTLLSGGGVPPAAVELVRRVGALPAEVLEYALKLDVDALRAAAVEVRVLRDQFRGQAARLGADVGDTVWEGAGAEAFRVAWNGLNQHLESMVERLDATAGYADGVAAWAAGFRHEVAEAVARVISSAEAVVVVTSGGVPAVQAAGKIAERVLRTAAEGLDAAEDLRRRWEPRVGRLEWQLLAVQEGAVIPGVTRVEL
ncbi:WXG100 family type VII secretion target [Dactylosporangium sp. CS-047395]|uniref:WXG100 family type VII secretion target n=1 Tax=Dactylosporangium sp. CS-047395 TaxID=3239936 RepID=UPI003D8FC6F8